MIKRPPQDTSALERPKADSNPTNERNDTANPRNSRIEKGDSPDYLNIYKNTRFINCNYYLVNMKEQIKEGLEKVVSSAKRHWKEIVTAIALPFIFKNNVDAGRIDVYNKSTDVSYSHMRIVHFNGATEGHDNYDSSYSENPNTLHIYSRNPLCDPSELWIDSRGPNSTTTYNLELLFNETFPGTANNMLTFVMKDDSNFTWKNIFLGDANDSNDIVADIKHIIDNGSVLPPPYNNHYGDFPLPPVDGSKTGVYDKRKVFFFNYTDFNRDRRIDGLDFRVFADNFGRDNETDPNTFGSYVGSDVNNFNAYADINRSGAVDFDDLNIFKTYFRLPGDLNLDGIVDNTDFAYFAPDWNATDVNSIADISGPYGIPDKNVDYWDLGSFSDHYLKDINEPSTW